MMAFHLSFFVILPLVKKMSLQCFLVYQILKRLKTQSYRLHETLKVSFVKRIFKMSEVLIQTFSAILHRANFLSCWKNTHLINPEGFVQLAELPNRLGRLKGCGHGG